jgi:hypothetical protein
VTGAIVSQLRRIWPSIAGAAGLLLRVILQAGPGLMGLLCLAYGAWLAWAPAGWMVFGGVVLADVILSRWPAPARSATRTGEAEQPPGLRAAA